MAWPELKIDWGILRLAVSQLKMEHGCSEEGVLQWSQDDFQRYVNKQAKKRPSFVTAAPTPPRMKAAASSASSTALASSSSSSSSMSSSTGASSSMSSLASSTPASLALASSTQARSKLASFKAPGSTVEPLQQQSSNTSGLGATGAKPVVTASLKVMSGNC